MAYPNGGSKAVEASREVTPGETIIYEWVHMPETTVAWKGARVTRLDRFGQRWVLDIARSHLVTHRVAAGLLGVTPMTIYNWSKLGVFRKQQTRNQVAVIPMSEIERIARERGLPLPFGE